MKTFLIGFATGVVTLGFAGVLISRREASAEKLAEQAKAAKAAQAASEEALKDIQKTAEAGFSAANEMAAEADANLKASMDSLKKAKGE